VLRFQFARCTVQLERNSLHPNRRLCYNTYLLYTDDRKYATSILENTAGVFIFRVTLKLKTELKLFYISSLMKKYFMIAQNNYFKRKNQYVLLLLNFDHLS